MGIWTALEGCETFTGHRGDTKPSLAGRRRKGLDAFSSSFQMIWSTYKKASLAGV